MSPSSARTRHVVVVDNSHVARRVGERIRQVRTRAGMTQAQVAQGRYTAAYISALERGLAKPSMAALTFLGERLGVAVTDLVAEERPAASRLEADLLLASGSYGEALDRYDDLLGSEGGADRRHRAELLRGRAEALCRLQRGGEAVRPASEASEIFAAMGDRADEALARYWLAFAHYLADNPAQARGILMDLLDADRAGLDVSPDFRFRLLTALGIVETWDGEANRGLTYMEEARALLADASLPQRAAFLSSLALQYRRVGDLERSIMTGHESLALYRAANAEREEGVLENNLALTFIDLGNVRRASQHLRRARQVADHLQDALLLSEVAEAEARLALAGDDRDRAAERAAAALDAAAQPGGSYLAAVGAHLVLARLAADGGRKDEAEVAFGRAADLLRAHGARSQLRDALAEWADRRNGWGDIAGANELYAEALGRSRGQT